MMSTDKMNAILQESRCWSLGVEQFYVDWEQTHNRPPDAVKTNVSTFFGKTMHKDEEFRCPVAQWRVDGKKFTGAIPLHFLEVKERNWYSSSSTWKLDEEAMQNDLQIMINTSRNN